MLVGRRLAAAARLTRRPVATLPVNATFATSGWPLRVTRRIAMHIHAVDFKLLHIHATNQRSPVATLPVNATFATSGWPLRTAHQCSASL